MSEHQTQWRGPFGMNVADLVVLILSSILLIAIAVSMALERTKAAAPAAKQPAARQATPLAAAFPRHR